MARNGLMFTRPDTSCGKVFYPDRRAADDHRIVLEVWNRATGGERHGYRLAVYQCVHCGGFHVGQKRIEKKPFERVEQQDRRLIRSEDLSYLAAYEAAEEAGDLNSELDSFSAEPETHAIGVPPEPRFDRPLW